MPAMMLTNAVTILGGVICAYGPNYIVFGIGRFLAGLGRIAVYAIALVYSMYLLLASVHLNYFGGFY